MSRTPDQDAADGLALATTHAEIVIGDLTFSTDDGGLLSGELVVNTRDDSYNTIYLYPLELTPDEADSLARVLQAWAARTREQAGPTMPADPWRGPQ